MNFGELRLVQHWDPVVALCFKELVQITGRVFNTKTNVVKVVALSPRRPYGLLGTGSPGRQPRLSHSSLGLRKQMLTAVFWGVFVCLFCCFFFFFFFLFVCLFFNNCIYAVIDEGDNWWCCWGPFSVWGYLTGPQTTRTVDSVFSIAASRLAKYLRQLRQELFSSMVHRKCCCTKSWRSGQSWPLIG